MHSKCFCPLLSPTDRRWHKYVEGFPRVREPSFALARNRRVPHSTVMGEGRSAKLSMPLRLPKRRQQVAAVCYRIRGSNLEFLLVQTRGGRWIFPKGGVEPGLTHAQSAALEAFEEAGVHGRIERIPFARYFRRKPDATPAKTTASAVVRSDDAAPPVAAHLCEVSRLERPQESNRNPSWFTADKAKRRLLEDRPPEFGAELVRIVDRAAARIHRLHGVVHPPDGMRSDGLQKVCFEAHEDGRLHEDLRNAALTRYFLPRPLLRLGAGETPSAEMARNVTPIDRGRRTIGSQPDKLSASQRKARASLPPN